jgi:hypothetical protein
MMKPEAHIVTTDSVEGFSAEQDRVAGCKVRKIRLLSESCFKKPHAPARKDALRRRGDQSRVTGADVGLSQEMMSA